MIIRVSLSRSLSKYIEEIIKALRICKIKIDVNVLIVSQETTSANENV